jgi:hypothetical protein
MGVSLLPEAPRATGLWGRACRCADRGPASGPIRCTARRAEGARSGVSIRAAPSTKAIRRRRRALYNPRVSDTKTYQLIRP